MLVKEYRIPTPLTVKEYQVAQLYMIAKKSREESQGAGNGLEILVNEPYYNGPGGKGQYTYKVYHIDSHVPGWIRPFIPTSALTVKEEAWNAYPYTKTRYTCPFLERFSLDIETKYFDDAGDQKNVFNLSPSELESREIDVIDMVKDQLYGNEYKEEEDPKLYVSKHTGRGPLSDTWVREYREAPKTDGRAIMCVYKLCRVEFGYWGIQGRIERYIHDVALRRTLLRAHKQVWAWQDEWLGMTIEDIRSVEKETQLYLARTMSIANRQNSLEQEFHDCCQSQNEKAESCDINLVSSNNPSKSLDKPCNLIKQKTDDRLSFDYKNTAKHLTEDFSEEKQITERLSQEVDVLEINRKDCEGICSQNGLDLSEYSAEHCLSTVESKRKKDSYPNSNEEFFDAEGSW
ncbi:protein retinal degeneration B-like [Limulus polyphemus]|uniref:Protein retinal degeneration B-like n=1 Tax=Limulus polyphemus TaxID=6850 RepID=A0ABM1B4P3_LIMPO|nr:protein retinal degeneration B-like [Limulus polyphemus]